MVPVGRLSRGLVSVRTTKSEEGEAIDQLAKDIVAIAQQRDRHAFARVFDHFAPRIKGFLMRSGSDSDTAEELAQEAMLKVWRKAALFDPARASASAWAFTIARNLRIDRHRRDKRAELYALTATDDDPPPIQPDESLLLAQRGVRVREAIAVLPPDQKVVVTLSFVEGKAHSEIAEMLQIPLGTVKSRMRLAMSKLRGILEDVT